MDCSCSFSPHFNHHYFLLLFVECRLPQVSTRDLFDRNVNIAIMEWNIASVFLLNGYFLSLLVNTPKKTKKAQCGENN